MPQNLLAEESIAALKCFFEPVGAGGECHVPGPDASAGAFPAGAGSGTAGNHARMATREELSRDLHRASVGDVSDLDAGGVVMYSDGRSALYDPGDSHSIIMSSTGSRKTTLIVIPTVYLIARAGECAFIADPKGEIYDGSAAIFQAKGYNVLRINLRDVTRSSRWNPLSVPYTWYNGDDVNRRNRGETMLLDFVKAVRPVESSADPYWEKAGQNALMGAGMILFRFCADPSKVNLRSLSAIVRLIAKKDSEMVDFIEGLEPGDPIKESLEPIIMLPDNTRNCVASMASDAMAPYTTQDSIAALLSEDDIRLDRIMDKKTVVFITTPDEKKTYNGVVSCFVKQSYEILVGQADSCDGHSLPRRVNYVIDEFASFPEIQSFDSMISAARSRNIRFMLVLQGLNQLYNTYGRDTGGTILGNCSNLFFLTSREGELLDTVIKLGGRTENGESLFTSSGLQRLDKASGECLVFHNRCHPCITSFVRFDAWADSRLDPKGKGPESSVRAEVPEVFDFGRDRMAPSRRGYHPSADDAYVSDYPLDAVPERRKLDVGRLSMDACPDDFHDMVCECLASPGGVAGLSRMLMWRILAKFKTRSEIVRYDADHRDLADCYPPDVASGIVRALDGALSLDDEELARIHESPGGADGTEDGEGGDAMAQDATVEELVGWCVDRIYEDESVKEALVFDILGALLLRYRSREAILSCSKCEEVADRYGKRVYNAMQEAIYKVRLLDDSDIESILEILES